MHEPNLTELIGTLRRVLARLERLGARDGRSLQQQVLDLLRDAGPLSTSAIARLIHRRRTDVVSTINAMAAAGQLVRRGEKWYAE